MTWLKGTVSVDHPDPVSRNTHSCFFLTLNVLLYGPKFWVVSRHQMSCSRSTFGMRDTYLGLWDTFLDLGTPILAWHLGHISCHMGHLSWLGDTYLGTYLAATEQCRMETTIRGASQHQIRSFFNIVQKGGGIKPMFKNFGANFV